MYSWAVSHEPRSWNEIEPQFLAAMEAFDRNVASGLATMGDLQNGKGDFFNDLLALLLERCAGVSLFSRGGVPGLIFPKHHLDVTFPDTGVVEFLVEAKAVGTPKHPGSPTQKFIGRPGSADLDKRVKEAAFKTIDLKAEFGRIQTMHGAAPNSGPGGGSLTTWLRAMRPTSYLFIAARVVSDRDLQACVTAANVAAQVLDAVGLYCYGPASPDAPTADYRRVQVPVTAHQLERVLFQACQDLKGIAAAQRVPAPDVPPPSAALADLEEDSP